MLVDPALEKIFKLDKTVLESTQVPIVTVSATFREDLKALHGLPEDDWLPDVVFSRAHYSMAVAIASQVWKNDIDPVKAWIFDPTNYVSHRDWRNIKLTEYIGKTIARRPVLKSIKDLVDKFGRNKLPILENITPPLLEVTKNISKPILSLHIAAGNILAEHGKTVVQVVTDPHVRYDYLNNADKKNITFCVFDEETKIDFLEKASILEKKVDPNRVIVTGPPIDHRVIKCRSKKTAWRSGVLKLCITTGGLGTNKAEIRKILRRVMPELRKKPSRLNIMVYAGTQKDIYQMVKKLAREEHVGITELTSTDREPKSTKKIPTKLSVLYHPQIVDANELLIQYAFPWADGFLTKPSGDMAYDAVAAGCFLLTLREWGEWEYQIQEVFEQKGIARVAKSDHICAQLRALTESHGKSESWVETAMNNAFSIDPLFLKGSQEIIKVYNKTT